MEYLLPLLYLIVPLAVGFGFGRYLEARHYKSIHQRESACLNVPVVNFKNLGSDRPVMESALAVGSVVVSVDYFKRFLTGFRKVFGGELHSYSSLLDRGRREAILRMRESCPDADIFLNCRLETASISKGAKGKIGCVEVIAYGTAVRFADEVRPETTG